jgi:cyclase
MANECFMPLSYGGGIRSFEQAEAVFKIGIEKVILNTGAVEKPEVVTEISRHFGSQAVIVSIDVRRDLLGHAKVRTHGGTRGSSMDVVQWAREAERLGAGEILLTSIEREGSWEGFDIELVRSVAQAVSVPVIAHGGCGSLRHVRAVVHEAGASAVALGSMVVFQKRSMGVLVNFPSPQELADALER